MSRPPPHLVLVFCALLVPGSPFAADYAKGLAPPGAPASAFPAPGRPVAGIVTDVWHDEQSRDRAGEAERVMNLLGDDRDTGAGPQRRAQVPQKPVGLLDLVIHVDKQSEVD